MLKNSHVRVVTELLKIMLHDELNIQIKFLMSQKDVSPIRI